MSMRQDQIERCDALWRELMDAGRVRWMDGMAWRYNGNPYRERIESDTQLDALAFPVWTDPATIGCLVAMAREAWSPIDISVARQLVGSRGPWWVSCDDHDKPPTLASAETEPEALLLAIQAATASQTPRPACNSLAR